MAQKKSSPADPPRVAGARRVAFPLERRLVLDTLQLGQHKPMMHGLLEVDVTRARRLLREHRARSGEALSFTAFVLACLGKAVAAHPEVHALRDWSGGVVLFDEVDATTMVEVAVEGRPFALAHVVRGINRRGVREISDEIRTVQQAGLGTVSPCLRASSQLLLRAPGFLRRLVYRALIRCPRLAKKHTGTLLVTSVGMFSGGAGWGFSAPGLHNFAITIGGIAWRAAAAAGGAERCENLCLTISANHELIDGAPVARFARCFTALLENAELLDDVLPEAFSP